MVKYIRSEESETRDSSDSSSFAYFMTYIANACFEVCSNIVNFGYVLVETGFKFTS